MTEVRRSRQEWIDVSVPLCRGMVHWPGDAEFEIKRLKDMERGDRLNLSVLTVGAHAGTHVDAPAHFVRSGVGIDCIPLDVCVGRARVIQIDDPQSVKMEELAPHRIRRGERILFRTRNSVQALKAEVFVKGYVFLSNEVTDFLVERETKLVGIDYLSIGGYNREGAYVHEELLRNGIWIVEALDLSAVRPGTYDMVCLPLRIVGAEASPARVMLKSAR